MKNLLIILFILFQITGNSFSQTTTISAKILNKNTKDPIEYAHVYVKGQSSGTLTNRSGSFSLGNVSFQDTIIISCLGYEKVAFKFTEKVKDIFLLTPQIYELATSEIKSGNSRIVKAGFTNKILDKNKIGGTSHGVIMVDTGLLNSGFQTALFVKNPTKATGLIQNVEFFLHKEGLANAPFRVRLYAANAAGMPSKDLIHENVIVDYGKNGAWVKVDLKKYQIDYPSNGFFIAMEWLQSNNRAFIYETKWKKKSSKTGKKKLKKEGHLNSKLIGFGQILGNYEQPNQTWTKVLNRAWEKWDGDSSFMIRSEIKVWE